MRYSWQIRFLSWLFPFWRITKRNWLNFSIERTNMITGAKQGRSFHDNWDYIGLDI